ncbi:gamma-glutamyltransferase [Spiractinospora alimapuensis]|uniref:gamma-glutamyltransferase n=1 Tax=Spiractinospora alimapuensis TaxID=2820884 RepID=UPI001F348D6F|nr:gamma-glutamyltransferase [Spiractinospora alimapuensis]QVQ52269.1 gamma-glutamyltransferase [Spiractinospora alimapuensis]
MPRRSHSPAHTSVSSRKAEGGSVTAPHESSVTAGLEALESGGNAMDAAVAAALVAGVVEPTETTLAGSGFGLYHESGGRTWSVDFGPKAPLKARSTLFEIDPTADSPAMLGLAPVVGNANLDGPLASGVPRTLLGLLTAQERFGRLPRARVCDHAVRAAHDGFPADTWFVTNAVSDLPRLRANPQTREVFLDAEGLPLGGRTAAAQGLSFQTRPRVRQATLGATLEEVSASGTSALVDGAVARRLVESAAEHGGLLSAADLRSAPPVIGEPVRLRFRDVDVVVPAAPGGGITTLQALGIWQALHPEATSAHADPTATRRLALALRHAFADRYHWLGDPALVPVPTTGLLDHGYAERVAELIRAGQDAPGWTDGPPWVTYASRPAHDPWPHVPGAGPGPVWRPDTATPPSSGTTHISVADADGNIASITHTAANHFGNGMICPRTGLLFDSAMAWFNAAPGAANSVSPSGRALANMAPALVTRDGQGVAALGASGGRRIISAVTQIVIDIVDGRHPVEDVLALPRVEASGRDLLLHEGLAAHVDAVSDLEPVVIPHSNEPFTMDFARPNLAGFDAAGTPVSAIATPHYND